MGFLGGSVNGAIVSREIKHVIWPMLKQAGFGVFSTRSAWRHREEGIDVVCFQGFSRNLADSIGVSSFSFAVRLGWFPNYVPPTYPPEVKNGKLLPQEYGCDFRGSVLRELEQPTNRNPEVWSIDEAGENLAWCIGDVQQQLPEVLQRFDRFQDRHEVLRRLLEDDDSPGLGATCNNPSPRRSYLAGYVALSLGKEELARQKLQEAVDSKCYVQLFTGLEGAIYRAR